MKTDALLGIHRLESSFGATKLRCPILPNATFDFWIPEATFDFWIPEATFDFWIPEATFDF